MVGLNIEELDEASAEALAEIFASDPEDYKRYFHPFRLDRLSLLNQLRDRKKDRWWGFKISGELVGMFMLRGFDEGYDRPSFGVYIKKDYQGKGLATLALRYSMTWCYINEVQSMLIKVYSENKRAARLYREIGFEFLDRCGKSGQEMLEYKFKYN